MLLLVWVLFGVICAAIANTRGRSAVAWFFIGLFLQVIALILVLVLPNLRLQQEREQRLHQENRRLRERVRKGRQVADQRHDETRARITVHDRALGVDTSERNLAGDSHDRLAPPVLPSDGYVDYQETEWYIVLRGEREGPLSFATLRQYWVSGEIQPSTLVWYKDLSDWLRVEDMGNLEEVLRA